jgi:hypothetical protein
MLRIIDGTRTPMASFLPQLVQPLAHPRDPIDKSDPYGDWVLLGTKEGLTRSALPVDQELLAAARNAWPHVLAHVRGEFFDKGIRRREDGAGRRYLGPSAPLSCENPPMESGPPTSYIQSGILPNWSFPPPLQ